MKSGIESILIVTGRNKKTIEDHFDKSVELEQILKKKGKTDLLLEAQNITDMAKIHYIRQKEPLGLGHAILCAEQFIGDEPFAVLLGDDIMVSDPPALKQLMDVFDQTGSTVIGVQPVQHSEVNKYGIISAVAQTNQILHVKDLVEKPSPAKAPSNIAIMGRYVLKPSVFSILKTQKPGAGDEYQLTDALQQICHQENLLALELNGERFDIGDKLGYMKAIIEMGLEREELHPELFNYLQEVVKKEIRKVRKKAAV
ncbi:UTP--glucose-1-phosphate uridylyltransferase GalU [Desulfitobacterium sp. AusDCA]